uniref:Uncharacterized protein n=1 Tax=Mesocestoides corti TaxID=53468 RepID=A0A5K3FLV0_MESCO
MSGRSADTRTTRVAKFARSSKPSMPSPPAGRRRIRRTPPPVGLPAEQVRVTSVPSGMGLSRPTFDVSLACPS